MPTAFSVDSTRTSIYLFDPEDIIIPAQELSGRFSEPSAEKIQNMVDSIDQFGQIEPIEVRKNHADQPVLVFGKHRLLAMRAINKRNAANKVQTLKIKAICSVGNESHAFDRAVQENLSRNECTAMDHAHNIGIYVNKFNLTTADIAKKYGRSTTWVEQHYKLLSLDRETQEKIHFGEISKSTSMMLSDIPAEKVSEVLEEAKAVYTDGKKAGKATDGAVRQVIRKKAEAGELEGTKPTGRTISQVKEFIANNLNDEKLMKLMVSFNGWITGRSTDEEFSQALKNAIA